MTLILPMSIDDGKCHDFLRLIDGVPTGSVALLNALLWSLKDSLLLSLGINLCKAAGSFFKNL